MNGNPHYWGMDASDSAETLGQRIMIDSILALAHEQRTANLVSLLSLPRSPKGTVWEEWEGMIHGEIVKRLGLNEGAE